MRRLLVPEIAQPPALMLRYAAPPADDEVGSWT
jgi:hypothetical protein